MRGVGGGDLRVATDDIVALLEGDRHRWIMLA